MVCMWRTRGNCLAVSRRLMRRRQCPLNGSHGLLRDHAARLVILWVKVSEQPVIAGAVDGPEPGLEQIGWEINADEPERLPLVDHGTHASHQASSEIAKGLLLQRFRGQVLDGTRGAKE